MAAKTEAMDDSPIEMEQPLGMYAADLFGRGCEFLEAFKVLSLEGDSRHRHPQYFILAHALELILKAYLAARGMKKETLHRIGHKILALERRSRKMGLPELENLDRLVTAIAEMNGDHDLRYPTGYNLSVPAPDLCLPIMEQLLLVARPVVSDARLTDALDLASKTRHLQGKKIVFNDPPKTNPKKPGGHMDQIPRMIGTWSATIHDLTSIPFRQAARINYCSSAPSAGCSCQQASEIGGSKNWKRAASSIRGPKTSQSSTAPTAGGRSHFVAASHP